MEPEWVALAVASNTMAEVAQDMVGVDISGGDGACHASGEKHPRGILTAGINQLLVILTRSKHDIIIIDLLFSLGLLFPLILCKFVKEGTVVDV